MSLSEKPINWIALRVAMVAVLFAVATLTLMVRAYRLQVTEAETLQKRAEKARTKVLHLEARRGMILDRSAEQLAASLEVKSVYGGKTSDRKETARDKKETARKLADILGIDDKDVLARLEQDKAFVWIQRRVSPTVADKIKQADLQGVFTVTEYQRFYPLKGFAAHALGFAGIDSRGLEGLELFYDLDLKADPVPVTAQRDALGRPVMFASLGRDPRRRDLHLTLDRTIQYVTERALEEAVQLNRAKSGIAIVMDADSGEILAMAVRPTYNINVFQKTSAEVRRNRAVADTFEPGSTFKVFLAAAALDLGKASQDEQFYCNKGLYRYNGAEIHDIVPYKNLSFDEVIINSSNIGAVKIAEKLSKGEFYRILSGFGFGAATEVDLPGERPGLLPLPGRWSVLTKANIAFGQGVTVNSLQMATAFCAAVNGGTLYRPHLMKKITNALGETIKEYPGAPVRTVIQSSTSEQITGILRQVVSKGTGKAAAIPGADVVGKTGTAQKADPAGGYSPDKYAASFVGAILDTKPRAVIFVLIDEPAGKDRTGGKVAAPVFRKIGEGILAMCGRKPDSTNLVLRSSGGGFKAAVPTPSRRVAVRKGPKPGEWIVPDLKGLDMREALDVCGKMKCDLSFQGTGLAVDQDPKPGKILKEGAPLTVSFEGQSS